MSYKNKHSIAPEKLLEAYLVRKQYYYNREMENIMPSLGDIVIDSVASTGDIAAVYFKLRSMWQTRLM